MRFEIQSLPTTTRTKSLKKQGSDLTRLVAVVFPPEFDVYPPNFLMALNDRKRPFTTVQEKQLFCSCKMDPTNTPRVFHVETTRRFNVEYTQSVCRGVFDHYLRKTPVKDLSFTKFVNSKFFLKSITILVTTCRTAGLQNNSLCLLLNILI